MSPRRLLIALCLAASVLVFASPALGATGHASRCARGCRPIVKPTPPQKSRLVARSSRCARGCRPIVNAPPPPKPKKSKLTRR